MRYRGRAFAVLIAVAAIATAPAARAVSFSVPVTENVNTHPTAGRQGELSVDSYSVDAIYQTFVIEPLSPYSDRLVGFSTMLRGGDGTQINWALYDGTGWTATAPPNNPLRNGTLTLSGVSGAAGPVDVELSNYLPVNSGDSLILELSVPSFSGLSFAWSAGDGLGWNPYANGTGYAGSSSFNSVYPYLGDQTTPTDLQVVVYVNVPEPSSVAVLTLGVVALGLRRRRKQRV